VGTGAVKINNVTLTSLVEQSSFEAKFQANQINSTAKCTLLDESRNTGGTPVDIKEQDDFVVEDDGVRIFGGRVARCQPQVYGKSVIWQIDAIGYDCLLDERVITSLYKAGTRSVQSEVQSIAAYHSELVATTYIEGGSHTLYKPIDYSRSKSLRAALQLLQQSATGYTFWVDENKHLHWARPSANQLLVNPSWDDGLNTGWSMGTTTSVTANVGPGGTGDYAAQSSNNTGTTTVQTVTSGITAGKRYVMSIDLYSSVAAQAKVTLTWQNNALATQRVDTITNVGTGWNRYKQVYTAPATADRVKVELGGVASFSGTIRFDNMALMKETAAFGIDTTPSNPTTYAPMGWGEDRQAIQPCNRVWVTGKVNGWRENAASIAYFRGKKFEGIIEDADVADADDINDRAQEVWRKQAFPARTGSYYTTVGGLVPGTWQIIKHDTLGITTIEWLATITTRFDGNSKMLYEVNYGNPEDSMGVAMAALGQVTAGTGGPVTGYADPVITTGLDTTPPGEPTDLTVSSSVVESDGRTSVRMVVGCTQPLDLDLSGTWIEYTRETVNNDDVTPDWSLSSLAFIPKSESTVVIEGVAGFTPYFIRAWSEDVNGLTSVDGSGYTYMPAPDYPYRTARDSSAPDVPVITGISPFLRGLAVSWSSSSAADLRGYQVRWTRDGTTWSFADVMANVLSITDLLPDVPYTVQVRAIDISGNVMGAQNATGVASTDVITTSEAMFADGDKVVFTSLTGGTGLTAIESEYFVRDVSGATFKVAATLGGAAINFTTDITQAQIAYASALAVLASSYPEAAWSVAATGTPALVGYVDIGANAIRAGMILAGTIDSASMEGQTITVKATGAYSRGFRVLTSTDLEAGSWDVNGLTIRDTTDADKNAKRFIRLTAGSLKLYTDGTEAGAVSAITPDGIDASRITFGTAAGGHNLVRNSSFELSENTGSSNVADTHTDTNRWNATYRTSYDNVTEGTTLAVTTWA
jgi:hypothetical protein